MNEQKPADILNVSVAIFVSFPLFSSSSESTATRALTNTTIATTAATRKQTNKNGNRTSASGFCVCLCVIAQRECEPVHF